MITVKIFNKSHHPNPEYATSGSAGFDLRANISEPVTLSPLERKLIPTGLFFEIPEGYEGQIRPRSGLSLKKGITVLNSPGTLDSDYRLEAGVILINLSNQEANIEPGERIAQMIISKHEKAEFEILHDLETFSKTNRSGGFGSTGTK